MPHLNRGESLGNEIFGKLRSDVVGLACVVIVQGHAVDDTSWRAGYANPHILRNSKPSAINVTPAAPHAAVR